MLSRQDDASFRSSASMLELAPNVHLPEIAYGGVHAAINSIELQFKGYNIVNLPDARRRPPFAATSGSRADTRPRFTIIRLWLSP